MNKKIIIETTVRSLSGIVTFPEVVSILASEGVESYHVDLVQNLKTCYSQDGDVFAEPFDFTGHNIGQDFSKDGVIDAIQHIQEQKINYRAFLNQILTAGCTGYTVYIDGKKVIYFGRKGELHVEEFAQ